MLCKRLTCFAQIVLRLQRKFYKGHCFKHFAVIMQQHSQFLYIKLVFKITDTLAA